MPRCGCSGTCSCILQVDETLTLTGNGSVNTPWNLGVSDNCDAAVNCLLGRIDLPLEVNADALLDVKVSGDPDQVLTTGSDGGLFVPGCVAGAVAIADSPSIDLSGTGQVGTPLKADWLGATVANGVATAGYGTGLPAQPLKWDWTGLVLSSTSPEIDITGNGTPGAPLSVGFGGLPFSKFTASGFTVANGATLTIPWATLEAHGGAPLIISTPNTDLDVVRSGSFLNAFRMRLSLTAASTTMGGYFLVTMRRTAGSSNWDVYQSTYGAAYVDVRITDQVTLANTNFHSVTIQNLSGSDATAGICVSTFVWFCEYP